MGLLTADEILNANDLPFEDVPVPEWGGHVRVRRLMASEWWVVTDQAKANNVHTDVQFCANVMTDEAGNQLFKPDQVAKLARKSWPALRRVYDVGMRLSGLGREEAKVIEKNSESPAATGPFSSDSPGI